MQVSFLAIDTVILVRTMKVYTQYRNWATKFGQKEIIVIGGVAGLVSSILVSIWGTGVIVHFLPWFVLLVGPIAAFDAFGAAAHRGAVREGVLRASVILAIFWGLAGFLFFS